MSPTDLDKLRDHYQKCMELVTEWGLEPFEVDFHVVPADKMYEIASYGVPGHFSHWTYGRDFWRQKTMYDYGISKIYELIINQDPAQAFLLENNTLLQNMFVISHCLGHCYLPGTMVSTTKGFVPIEDIHLGDRVYTDNTNPVYAQPTKRFYSGRVVTLQAGGQTFTQTEDHRLLVRGGQDNQWVRAVDIIPGDRLVAPSPWRRTDIIETVEIPFVEYAGKQAKRANPKFEIPLDEGFGELIGLYLAEGYVREGGQMGLCFHIDETHLHDMAERLVRKYFHLPVYHTWTQDTHSHQVLFNSKQIAPFMTAFFGRGSANKSIPNHWIKRAPIEFLRGLLRGYIYGDGHIGEYTVSYSTTSSLLAQQIAQIARLFGVYFHYGYRNRADRKVSFELRVNGQQSRKLREELALPPIDPESKRGSPNRTWSDVEEESGVFYVKVKTVSVDDYEGNVYCLNVPLRNCFTLANGIITHNSDFFANNVWFSHTNRSIEHSVAATADRFREYELKYGRLVVEDFIDKVISISEHIDPHFRTRKKTTDYVTARPITQYIDLFPEEEEEIWLAEVEEEIDKYEKFPYEPERDLLGFIAQHGKMHDWKRDIMLSIREEMIYFLPQMQTKIMNEGWASLIHHRLMHELDPEVDPGGVEFSSIHSSVLSGNPGSLNPYWLGYKLFHRIIDRWNDPSKEDREELRMPGNEGWEKALEVRSLDSDESFLRNYLDKEICVDLDLFSYAYNDEERQWEVTNKDWEFVRDTLVHTKANMGMPYIVIEDADWGNKGELFLRHYFDGRELHLRYLEETLRMIQQLWGRPVLLETMVEGKKNLFMAVDEHDVMRSVPI